MDLKLPIQITDELSDDEVRSQGELDLASGEIRHVRYEDYDVATQGIPAARLASLTAVPPPARGPPLHS